MENDKKVFSSDITRGNKPLRNNLYELISVEPATPIKPCDEKERQCDFQPNLDKQYVPKKRARHSKVKTVGDIRNLFETDINVDLSKDLERQRNLLLKKITAGSAREENTKTLAKSMIKCDKPIARSAWQMLMNLNPDGQTHAIQYVLWNGRRIRINGSKGGKHKFFCNYDLAKIKTPSLKKPVKNIGFKKKNRLLCNSLIIKFKPGPLTKKKQLDDSYQKYNLGNTESVQLPVPGLAIRPTYGVPLEPSVAKFVQNLRASDGTISDKWAEFAVSMLCSTRNSELILNEHPGITFELNYKLDQRQMLMRRDLSSFASTENYNEILSQESNGEIQRDDDNNLPEIKAVVKDMISCVEINFEQDNLFTVDEQALSENTENLNTNTAAIQSNSKGSKRRYNELDRLDVTVIRLPEDDDSSTICNKAHCSLGCICASLKCSYNLKQHCGRLECMFECKCDFSKYKATDSFKNNCPEFIPGLINLDNELNLRLAKEEQKFHQTVVVTGEKSILLKSERRNCKASKRYAEFYDRLTLKNTNHTLRELSITCPKLNCENIQPWCMVHNLYKCFCKGKFTQNIKIDTNDLPESNKIMTQQDEETCHEDTIDVNDTDYKTRLRNERSSVDKKVRKQTIYDDTSTVSSERTLEDSNSFKARYPTEKSNNEKAKTYSTLESDFESNNHVSSCARTQPFLKRKYSNLYYKSTNKKILEMERNDDRLRKKMLCILNKSNSDSDTPISQNSNDDNSVNIVLQDSDSNSNMSDKLTENAMTSDELREELCGQSNFTLSILKNASTKTMPLEGRSLLVSNKQKLISWLEASYKQYKHQEDMGIVRKSLIPPKHGKVALYPWDFILSRYRERKNLFLVSAQKPFRIFMAVDVKNNFFENCINIDDIRFADLNKYPVTIKNLLTNATDIKDNFCILCGLSHCWELIGSVTKVRNQDETSTQSSNEQTDTTKESEDTQHDLDFKTVLSPSSLSDKEVRFQTFPDESTDGETESAQMESKWFVMTVENDFQEIQFYKRGFFVKYESIVKAINVARLSGKTVRLSSQKCVDQNAGPQFGIYAIPNANEYCVFIGPYEKDEPLGIETVKTFLDVRKTKRTRGIWITTKKVDNIKVIDNPLSFMPPNDSHPSKIVPLENDLSSYQSVETENDVPSTSKNQNKLVLESPKKEIGKIVKPIKIRKTNGFYHFATRLLPKGESQTATSSSLLPPPPPPLLIRRNVQTETSQLKKTSLVKLPFSNFSHALTAASVSDDSPAQIPKPIAEIAPQIKIMDVSSIVPAVTTNNKPANKKFETGMLILKPEEINKRLMEKRITPNVALQAGSQLPGNLSKTNSPQDIDQDIENFLATTVCVPPNEDVLVISDGEDSDGATNRARRKQWSNVWIECQNNDHLGWIPGRKDNKSQHISFEFPGFKFTSYYPEEEAFLKINQVLSRKIYVPKNIKLEWRVVEKSKDLRILRKLDADILSPDFVLTRRGLRHKRDLIASSKLKVVSSSTSSPKFRQEDVDKAVDMMTYLEDQSKSLDDENDKLLNAITKTSEMLKSALQDSIDQQNLKVNLKQPQDGMDISHHDEIKTDVTQATTSQNRDDGELVMTISVSRSTKT